MATTPDLYHWDTAFAMRLSHFNRLIAASTDTRAWTHPPSAGTVPPPRAIASWQFGAWSVSRAVGSEIELTMPLQPGGTLTMDGVSYDLTGCQCRLTTEMVLKPITAPQTHGLGAASRHGGPWAEVEVLPPNDAFPFQVTERLTEVLDSWFQTDAALQVFDAHFDGLRVQTALTADGAPWLVPRAVGFAGATLPDGDLAIGLLARVEQADDIGAQFMLSPYVIPEKQAAGFVISIDRFFGTLLVPALAHAFGADPGKLAATFKVADGVIQNLTPLTFPVTTANGQSHVATVPPQQLVVSIDGDALVLDLRDMSFAVNLGPVKWVTIHLSMVERLHAELRSPQGQPQQRVLTFTQSGTPQVQRRDEDSWAKLGGEVLVEIGVAIASVFLLKYLSGAKEGVSIVASRLLVALGAVIATEVGQLINDVPDFLAGHLTDDDLKKMGNFGSLIDDGLAAVSWQMRAGFDLTDVAFADSLQCTINIGET